MKTTLEIPDPIFRRAKQRQAFRRCRGFAANRLVRIDSPGREPITSDQNANEMMRLRWLQ
jgi:hypothetical protein